MRAFRLFDGKRLRRLARSVVGQMFLLQAALITLLVAAAVLALALHTRKDETEAAFGRALSVAVSFAEAPGLREALREPDPTAELQPRAEAVRRQTGVDVVVVMDREGIRFTHPETARIGKRWIGSLREAQRGGVVRESVDDPMGRAHQVVVPVRDPDGTVVGLVGVAVATERVDLLVSEEMPLPLATGALALLLALGCSALLGRRLLRQTRGVGPAEVTRMFERRDAVLRAVREGVVILDGRNGMIMANEEARRLVPNLPPDGSRRHVGALGLDPATTRLLATSDREMTDEVHLCGGRLLTVNHRLIGRDGSAPPSSVTTIRDVTEMHALSDRAEAAQRRLQMLYRASVRIGTTLDVRRTAEELAAVAVPDLADAVTVDLSEEVLRGAEMPGGVIRLRRIALESVGGDTLLHPLGTLLHIDPAQPRVRELRGGQPMLETDLAGTTWWRVQSEEHAQRLVDGGYHSLISAPLHARGVVLGVVNLWRRQRAEQFDSDDLSLAAELASRTAVNIDNARRFSREHEMAATLQRSLLPSALPEQSAVHAAYRYRPAAAVGGDFFDIIPLSGARVALVVGDVVGHGLHAAVTMGRLRTAVHNFAALDLPPDELLGRLDELADRIDRESADQHVGEWSGMGALGSFTGATCLYAVYDPVEGRCTVARAGHLPPALVFPDGRVEFPELPGQPPLGVGGMPFQTGELNLPEGTRLVLYTDGLVEARNRDIDVGFDLLHAALADSPGGDPEATCDTVLERLLPERPNDDVALLVARTRVMAPWQVASWEVPATPASVTRVRREAARRLAEWGMEDASFVTELILTELITNAVRHAEGPARVRLLRDRTLICEVADSSSTSPHLRYASETDEGGRGLFLVAKYADRWGTRYTATGKIIWAEQRLPRRHG
ncbi:SpoIIE family protein phosphatase [Streptomyces sp. DSM 44917]|uniref:SpoIIE family protein phosphatase n=1 Tax=Streptomyces boetiae TaxID=3075541 RepID=A0ABU2L1V5_9ACTN|nr:SpoIIE family protein phosphatase [Streptomyces sp. DSM 44917]MDT0305505.1 SpoIIE family protein phosphatase [Streptomyces sp. DSM 44917]